MSRDRNRPRLFRGAPSRRAPGSGTGGDAPCPPESNESQRPGAAAVSSGPGEAQQVLDAFEERPTIRIEIAPAGAADGGVVAAGSAADVPAVPPTVPDADPGSSDPGDGQTAAARPLRIFVGLPSGAVPSTRSAEPVWDASAAAAVTEPGAGDGDHGAVAEGGDWATESATEEVLIDPRVVRAQLQPQSADPHAPVTDPQAAPDPPAWDDHPSGDPATAGSDGGSEPGGRTRPTDPAMPGREMPVRAPWEENRDVGGEGPLLGWDDAEAVSIAVRELGAPLFPPGEPVRQSTQPGRAWDALRGSVRPRPDVRNVADAPAPSSWMQVAVAAMTVVAVAAAALKLSSGPGAGTDPLALLQWAMASPASATTATTADPSVLRSARPGPAVRKATGSGQPEGASAGGRSLPEAVETLRPLGQEVGIHAAAEGQQRATTATLPASDESGLLRVKMDFDAVVYVDGRWAGEGPIDALELPVGLHRVSVVPTGGGRVREVVIGVAAQRPSEVRFGR